MCSKLNLTIQVQNLRLNASCLAKNYGSITSLAVCHLVHSLLTMLNFQPFYDQGAASSVALLKRQNYLAELPSPIPVSPLPPVASGPPDAAARPVRALKKCQWKQPCHVPSVSSGICFALTCRIKNVAVLPFRVAKWRVQVLCPLPSSFWARIVIAHFWQIIQKPSKPSSLEATNTFKICAN